MERCEIKYCEGDASYRPEHNVTLCNAHYEEYKDDLYWEEYYKEQGIGAYAGKKRKVKA